MVRAGGKHLVALNVPQRAVCVWLDAKEGWEVVHHVCRRDLTLVRVVRGVERLVAVEEEDDDFEITPGQRPIYKKTGN